MNAQNAAAAIASFTASNESFSANPYYDVNGYAIGYGNHYYQDGSAVSADDPPITQDDATALMVFYLAQGAAAIIPQLKVSLSDGKLGVLADVHYNCGHVPSTLMNLINSGADDAAVSAQIEKTCTTSGGVTNQGLVDRAAARAALWLSPPQAADLGTILAIATGAIVLAIVLGFGK